MPKRHYHPINSGPLSGRDAETLNEVASDLSRLVGGFQGIPPMQVDEDAGGVIISINEDNLEADLSPNLIALFGKLCSVGLQPTQNIFGDIFSAVEGPLTQEVTVWNLATGLPEGPFCVEPNNCCGGIGVYTGSQGGSGGQGGGGGGEGGGGSGTCAISCMGQLGDSVCLNGTYQQYDPPHPYVTCTFSITLPFISCWNYGAGITLQQLCPQIAQGGGNPVYVAFAAGTNQSSLVVYYILGGGQVEILYAGTSTSCGNGTAVFPINSSGLLGFTGTVTNGACSGGGGGGGGTNNCPGCPNGLTPPNNMFVGNAGNMTGLGGGINIPLTQTGGVGGFGNATYSGTTKACGGTVYGQFSCNSDGTWTAKAAFSSVSGGALSSLIFQTSGAPLIANCAAPQFNWASVGTIVHSGVSNGVDCYSGSGNGSDALVGINVT